MESDSVLQLDYLSLAELAERPAAWWQNVLGLAAFDAAAPRAPSADIPMASVPTPVLGTSGRRYEVWQAPHAARSGTRGRIQYRGVLVLFLGARSLARGEFAGLPARPALCSARLNSPTAKSSPWSTRLR